MRLFAGVLLFSLCLGVAACSKEVKNSAEAKNSTENEKHWLSAQGEVRSIAGRWRAQSDNRREAGIWEFGKDGKCVIRDPGLRENTGNYTYNGKELVLSMDAGSSRYTITENNEPQLKLHYRWGDKYDINITLIHMPD